MQVELEFEQRVLRPFCGNRKLLLAPRQFGHGGIPACQSPPLPYQAIGAPAARGLKLGTPHSERLVRVPQCTHLNRGRFELQL